jgi:hypothetical protein
MTIWRMRIACWILQATNTLSEYVILIALPLEQWLQKLATMLGLHTLPVSVFVFMIYCTFYCLFDIVCMYVCVSMYLCTYVCMYACVFMYACMHARM